MYWFTHAAAHADNAANLVAQIISWRKQPDVDAAAMQGLEQRALAHITPLALVPVTDADEEAADNPEQVWVLLARRLLGANDGAAREVMWSQAHRRLLGGGASTEGAFEFLRCVPAAASPGLETLFDEHASLRPAILRIWRDQAAVVPLERLDRHAATLDADGRLALIEYTAMRHDVAPDFFTPYAGDGDKPAVRAAAIRALLVRSAAAARPLLQRALADAADNVPLLEVAALTGDPAFFDTLLGYATAHPDTGLALIALGGLRQAVQPLLNALAEPRTAGPAAAAWHWLTGQRLPDIARLQVVGEAPKPVLNPRPEERESLTPDLAAAQRWWGEKQHEWEPGQRYLLGQPMTADRVARQAAEHAGRHGALLHGLLELLLGKPLAVSPETWIARRLAGYREAGFLGSEGDMADARPPTAERRRG